jgi:hypothetical protein
MFDEKTVANLAWTIDVQYIYLTLISLVDIDIPDPRRLKYFNPAVVIY